MPRIGSKEKIRRFLLANIGRVIESHELQEAADGALQYSRRLRELREEEGWPILSHNDSANLTPGQYMLKEVPTDRRDLGFVRGISAKLRAEVLDRNGFTCQMCGLTPGDIDPATSRTVRTPAHLKKLKQLFEAAPISRYLGMTLSYCENGVARVRLPFRAEFEERHGVIHGGLIGLLADTAGNFAVGSVSPGSTVKTVEFKMSLLAGVQEDLLATGEVVRKGRTLATCRLEVVGGNDHVVAIGLATYALQAV